MSKKQMTLVYYYIPEDHDDEDTPNVFGVMVSKNNIRLHHLYENFPLKGSYVFRFKVMYDNTIAWLDLPDLETKLPTYKDKIIIKATRISWETNQANPFGHYRFLKKDQNVSQSQQLPKHSNVNIQPQPGRVEKTQTVPVSPKTQHMDLLGQKHQPVVNSTKNILQTSDLLSNKHEMTSPKNATNLPHDFNFDLLSTPATTSKTSNSDKIDLGNLLI